MLKGKKEDIRNLTSSPKVFTVSSLPCIFSNEPNNRKGSNTREVGYNIPESTRLLEPVLANIARKSKRVIYESDTDSETEGSAVPFRRSKAEGKSKHGSFPK